MIHKPVVVRQQPLVQPILLICVFLSGCIRIFLQQFVDMRRSGAVTRAMHECVQAADDPVRPAAGARQRVGEHHGL